LAQVASSKKKIQRTQKSRTADLNDIELVRAIISEILAQDKHIRPEPAPLADSSVDFVVRPWV